MLDGKAPDLSRFAEAISDALEKAARSARRVRPTGPKLDQKALILKNLDQGITYDERLSGDLLATIANSTVTGNDVGSQEIDFRGEQTDDGLGILTLDNVSMGDTSLVGLSLVTNP